MLDDFFEFLRELGGLELMGRVPGTALQRETVPVAQSFLLCGLETVFGIESMHALPALLCGDEALMLLVGFSAQQLRHGVCHQGAAKRQRPRAARPICPESLTNNLVLCICGTWRPSSTGPSGPSPRRGSLVSR